MDTNKRPQAPPPKDPTQAVQRPAPHAPAQPPPVDEPVRAGGDEDVTGPQTPVDMETYKARWGDRPPPGLLDTTPDEPDEDAAEGPPPEKA